METNMLEEDLYMFEECLSQDSPETQRQRGTLQCLAKQEELKESAGLLSNENSVSASYENCQQVLQQLEVLLAQCEEQCEAACLEAGVRGEETQQGERHYAKTVDLLHQAIKQTEVLRREIRNFEEEVEEEEACHLQKMKEAETPETALPEMVEEQMEKDLLARRRGFLYWLQMLCVLFVIPELVVLFFLAAAVLYASCCNAELLYHLLLHVLHEETYYNMAYALGRILTVVSEGPLPF
nr:uncharacterized protein LOC110356509 isoform X2 [Columba livia]